MPSAYFLIFNLDNSRYISFEEYIGKVCPENFNCNNISSGFITKAYEITKTVKSF